MPRLSEQRQYGLSLIVLFVVYFATALFGLSLHAVNTFAAYIWPPTGIAIAALMLYGIRLWPAVFLGAFFANVYTGAPFQVALGIACGNTLEAVFARYILHRFAGEEITFGKLRESFVFVFGVAITATAVSATIGVFSLFVGGVLSATQLQSTWSAWWVGDMLGAIIISPFLLRWLTPPYYQRSSLQLLEMLAVAVATFAFGAAIFWTHSATLPYPILVPLVWAALRTGPRGVTLAVLVATITALSGTLAGRGLFGTMPIRDGLFSLQLFTGTIASIFLIFASVVEDRRRASSEMKVSLDKLELALNRLRAEDAAKNQFIATLAHELRNPLAPIRSAIEIIRLRSRRGEILEEAGIIEKYARSMSRLLEDLLDVSRISAQKLGLAKKPLYLRAPVAAAVESVQEMIKLKNQTLTVSINPRPLLIEADPLRLEQIITNLLSNASKYTAPGGNISLNCSREGQTAIISVRDTGVGIATAMLRRIFDPFVQLRTNAPVGGIGVGLTLVKRLVELHGGTIEARSSGEGQGSEFIVELPLPAPNAFVQETNKEAEERKRSLQSLKILVVDDNIDAAQSLGRLLEMRGHIVTLAHDGASALKNAAEVRPDVIVLDIGLPDTDGYAVARELKKAKIKSSLIALTGYGQKSDKAKARKAGFHYHIVKPVGIAQLEEALAKVVAS